MILPTSTRPEVDGMAAILGWNGSRLDTLKGRAARAIRMSMELFRRHAPEHAVCTSIAQLKNSISRKHSDKNNIGPSYAISLGTFSGGELNVAGEDVDTHDKLVCFDGKQIHESKPFAGVRYSLIFFTSGFIDRTTKDDTYQLEKLGFIMPRQVSGNSSGTPQRGFVKIKKSVEGGASECRARRRRKPRIEAEDTLEAMARSHPSTSAQARAVQ